jgi:hypothetical protein
MPLLGWLNNLFHDSTLTVDRNDIHSAVGFFLGYSRTTSSWSAAQLEDVNAVVEAGERQFYFPPVLPGKRTAHKWRFLSPTATLTTVSGTADYEMPADFGGMVGDLTFGESEGYWPLPRIAESEIRRKRQYNTGSGQPQLAAVRPKASDGDAGQKYEILLWPDTDGVYNLTYRYIALMNKMSDTNRFPLGNAPHGETILASCLAVAEERLDDKRGVKWQRFMERLAASVSHDELQAPERLGLNRNDTITDTAGRYRHGEWFHSHTVTYQGGT